VLTTTLERTDAPEVEASPAPKRRSLVRRVCMWPRRALVRIHRWLSFGLLAWLVIISVTGAWLVFDNLYESWLHPDRYEASEGDVGSQEVIDDVTPELPEGGYVYYVSLPTSSRGVYQAYAAWPTDPDDPELLDDHGYPAEEYGTWYVDPGTGEINDVTRDDEGFGNWMFRGHMYLWQDHGPFGVFETDGWCGPAGDGVEAGGAKGVVCDVIPYGDDLVAWFGVGWIVVLLTGFYLWYWPGVKRWANAVRIQRGRGRFTFQMSLHKAIGFVVWIPLLVIAFTGITFAFTSMGSWFENVTPAQRDFSLWIPPDDALSERPSDDAEPMDADEFLATVEERYPDRQVQSIAAIPAADDDTGTWQAWVTRGFDPWTREAGAGNTLVVSDQFTGEVLYDGSPEEGNVFDQAWDDYVYPVHTGEFLGIPSQLVWFAVSLGSIALGVTGTVMWLVRHNKRKAAAARQTKKDAEAGGGTGEDDPADDAEVAVTP
jgi:uncharacterized iron-regulated membrane protein